MRLEIQYEDRIGMVWEVLDLFIPHQIRLWLTEADTKYHCIYCIFLDIDFTKLRKLLDDLYPLDGIKDEDLKTIVYEIWARHNAIYTVLGALTDGLIVVDLKGGITIAIELASQN